jgi:hypothetical protein
MRPDIFMTPDTSDDYFMELRLACGLVSSFITQIVTSDEHSPKDRS